MTAAEAAAAARSAGDDGGVGDGPNGDGGEGIARRWAAAAAAVTRDEHILAREENPRSDNKCTNPRGITPSCCCNSTASIGSTVFKMTVI